MYLTLKCPLKIKQCLIYNPDLKLNEELDKTRNLLYHGMIYSCQWLSGLGLYFGHMAMGLSPHEGTIQIFNHRYLTLHSSLHGV